MKVRKTKTAMKARNGKMQCLLKSQRMQKTERVKKKTT